MKGPAIAVAALGMSIALLGGCKKNIQNDDAVRQGIMTYLAKRPDLLSMDVNVTSVAYRQDQATATVRFQAKGNTSPGASMTMQYVLERQGNQWNVKGRAGTSAHGANGLPTDPSGAGSMSAMPNTTMPPTTMPPGHPSVDAPGSAPSGVLPPGHPPISSAGPSK